MLFTPFDKSGTVDEQSLRRVVRFELEGAVNGLGYGGFASEAYKLTDQERLACTDIVADEIDGSVPLIIGLSSGSTEVAIKQAQVFNQYNPAALMVLPPCTMPLSQSQLVDHYVSVADASSSPVMVQSAPQFPAYAHSPVSVEAIVEIARRTENVTCIKVEGRDAANQIRDLRRLLHNDLPLFGGGGGITWLDELRSGAAGVIPGCGFNNFFVKVWHDWQSGREDQAATLLKKLQPILDAISGKNHEYSVTMRKQLFKRLGVITSDYVRHPCERVESDDVDKVSKLAESLDL